MLALGIKHCFTIDIGAFRNENRLCCCAMDPSDVHVIKPVMISAVIITNVILNSLVIAVIARYPQLREDRTTLFVFSLTLSDLAVGCTVMPISAAVCSNATPDVRNMTHYLSAIQRFCFIWFSFNSAYSLCWLTVSKMIALLHPFRHEQLFSHRRCYVIIGCVWLTGVLIAAAGNQTFLPWNLVTCIYDASATSGKSVITTITALLIALPLMVIVYATARIFCVVVRAHLQITAQVNSIGGQVGVIGNYASLTMQSIRSGRNVLFVCLGVLVLTMPSLIVFLARSKIHVSSSYLFAAIWMTLSNSFVNSLLYLILFRGVRKKTATLFRELYQSCALW